jgi:hypothetical protein
VTDAEVPRFVILEHAPGPASRAGLHWDLMLEAEEVLWTWALSQAPAQNLSQVCERLADHRLDYLDYEGAISGDRGTVTRWDRGEYELLQRANDQLELRLRGERLRGFARLTRQEADGHRWVLDLSAA